MNEKKNLKCEEERRQNEITAQQLKEIEAQEYLL